MDPYENEGSREFVSRGGDGLHERSTPELLKEAVANGQLLLREEVRLAKAELRLEAKKAGAAGASFGVGGALLFAALLTLCGCLVALGALFLPLWLSALFVGLLVAAAGGLALWAGKKSLEKVKGPGRTLETLKEDGRWAKDTMQRVRSQRHGHA